MANDLTGAFDVVAEFSIPAANRVLAAMHGRERFAHSFALRVDDNKLPGTNPSDPSVFGSFDSFGEASIDHDKIPPRPVAGTFNPRSPAFSLLDSIVNVDLSGGKLQPLPPSQLQGRAQLQLSPPTIDVTDSSGKKVTIKMGLMSRYLPDPNTPPVAQFVRGELQITAAVNEVASQVGNVVDIDIKGDTVTSSFTPTFTSEPVSLNDLAGVNQLIRNALRTSFLPSNATLPSNISHIQFKTLRGPRNALAILLNMAGPGGNPASQTNVFLAGGDEFAIGAGIDFIRAKFQPTIDGILAEPIPPVSFSIPLLVTTIHITYNFTINSVTLDLINGSMVLTTKGRAVGDNGPDFNFTVTQPLTLKVIGSTAELEIGDFSLTASNGIINRFIGRFKDRIRRTRDRAIDRSNVQDTVRSALNADDMLGGLLDSLLKPASPKPGPQPRGFRLAYTSAEIRPSGIVLHGSLAVSGFPAPHVEFEQIPPVTVSGGSLGGHVNLPDFGPDYSALNSWIPGGTIQRYEWSARGQSQPIVNDKTFVFIQPPPELSDGSPSTSPVSGYSPLCLRIFGTRLSPSGPVTAQSVTARACLLTSFPLIDVVAQLEVATPTVSVTHPDSLGMIQVAGQTVARQAERGSDTPNLLVHFADDRSAGELEVLKQALRASAREDAITAILAVLSPDQLSKTRYTPGVIYSEDRAGWERALGVVAAQRPLTLIVGPKRHVVWKQDGDIDAGALAGALRKFLVAGKRVKVSILRAKLRVGQLPPNFLFEHARGRELTLRKLAGQPVTLAFWKSSTRPSVEAVLDLQSSRQSDKGDGLLLAINDGEDRESAIRFAAANGISATIVTDPNRRISEVYGVNLLPTIVSVDAQGVIQAIRYGRDAGDSEAGDSEAGDSIDYSTQQEQPK